MSEWQPIETAPKNTSILVSWGRVIRIAENSSATGKWWSEYGHELTQPNNWMPLPSPPEGA